jgi:Phage holin T7 family, holin superfamily II
MNIVDEFKKHLMVAGIKVAPPAGISVWLTLGMHLDTWIKVAALIYTVGQIAMLGVKAWLLLKKKMKVEEDDD